AALLVAIRFGGVINRLVFSPDDEVLLLRVFGLALLVAGLAEQLQVSAAVGAFLIGIALSGRVAEGARELLSPLRDLFAAVFFVFFGLRTDPSAIPPVLLIAALLALVTTVTKVATGWLAARRAGVGCPAGEERASAAHGGCGGGSPARRSEPLPRVSARAPGAGRGPYLRGCQRNAGRPAAPGRPQLRASSAGT